VPRVISFIVLLAIVLLVGVVFFQVMAHFLVPLFLACVLLVMFQPLHRWILRRLPKHPRVAALITTVLILLVVLLPLVSLGWNAYRELRQIVPHDDASSKAVAAQALSAVPADSTPAEDSTEQGDSFVDRLHIAAIELRNRFQELSGIEIKDDAVKEFVGKAGEFVATKALGGVQFALGTLIGLAIMVIALYYFLADGPAMIDTVMDLSPLDASYEQELLERFGDV
jgi:predicted PurR-regulated permease PerM